MRRVRRLFWCGCCFCPCGGCAGCGGCGRSFKFQTLPLWFLLGRALPHSPPEEDTVVLRARATGLGLDADNRRASVTWCTRSKVHRCCELPMQKLFSLYQNAAGSDYEERFQPICSCDISQSAHKRSNNLWRHLSFASSQPVWIVIYVRLDTRQHLFVEPVAYSSLVFMDQSLGFYVSTQLGEGGGGDGHLTR